VAREGERATPTVPAPTQLRRYLNFARLPEPALVVARRVLDDDPDFRERVARSTGEVVVGRAGWLFLDRPGGWLEELDELLQQAAAAELAAKSERHERGAQRKLAGAEAALARAEAVTQAATSDLAVARAEVAGEREAHRATAARLARAEAEVDRLQRERTDLIRRLKSTEASAVERAAELRATRHELRMAQAELAQAGLASGDAGPAADPNDASVAPAAPAAPAPPAAPAGIDRALVAELLDEARSAIGRLDGAFERFVDRASLGPPPPEAAAPPPPAVPAGTGERRERRSPLPLPPATFDDSVEAAEHLVRATGALVLVDGYNISHARWHGRPPAEQRERLLAACDELHARLGTEVEVVFDGVGDDAEPPPLRTGARHRFTPAGTEADDAILAIVDDEPASRPVVVVSSDRRVRDGARARGANLLGAQQFLHVLRR
jgi:predicted RNA-binding protein with PIN domain